MKTRGIVWIPGFLTGMLLRGADPMEAATIQMREEIGLVFIYRIIFPYPKSPLQ